MHTDIEVTRYQDPDGKQSAVPKVSVLTPIYNVEKYLSQCLESLKNQTLAEIEFICINDGSTDGSRHILENFAKNDSRFVVVNKPNSGYGASMNVGLELARGEYIGIVESDDWADSNMFENLYKAAVKADVDVCKSNYFWYTDLGGSTFVSNYADELCDQAFRPLDSEWQLVMGTTPAIWSAVYRRAFLESNGIVFNETPGAAFQDTAFVFKSWIAARKAIIVKEAYLHYRIDRADASVRVSNNVYRVCDEYASVEDWLKDRPEDRSEVIHSLNARKVHTYMWNVRRIGEDSIEGFILRASEELNESNDQGEFDIKSELITDAEREFARRLLSDTDELIRDEIARTHMTTEILISVIVPTYNNEKFIRETLASLCRQTLRDIEILVINDGSTDATQSIVDEMAKKDSRIVKIVFDQNRGVGAARNAGLENARGKCIAFCDGDDLVPATAYEALYKALMAANAQMAVGGMSGFTSHSEQTYSHPAKLSSKDSISKHAIEFNFNWSLCNKLFLRRVIEENGLSFSDCVMGEDGIFHMEYLRFCDRIVGAHQDVYEYRQVLYYQDKPTATDRVDERAITDYCDSMNRIIDIRMETLDESIRNAEADGNAPLSKQLRAQKALCYEDLQRRYCSQLLERYYRFYWMLTPDAFEAVRQNYEIHRNELFPETVAGLRRMSPGFQLDAEAHIPDSQQLIEHPLVSVVLSNRMSGGTVPSMMESLYRQRFTSFEIIMPRSLSGYVPEQFKGLPNIKLVDAQDDTYLRDALNRTRSPFINLLEDPIFHCHDSLGTMYRIMSVSRTDFVAVNMACCPHDEEVKFRTIREVFRPQYAEKPTIRTPLNELDCSINNKIFKRQSLIDSDLRLLSNDARMFVRRAYVTMSFRKEISIQMVSRITDEWFMEGASPKAKATREITHLDAVLHSEWFKKQVDKVGTRVKTTPQKVVDKIVPLKRQVLFTTNRSDDLGDNMRPVYEALSDVKRATCCHKFPHTARYDKLLDRCFGESKVVVTDDYLHVIERTGVARDQKIVQLWHACGAYKKFALDYYGNNQKKERLIHGRYAAAIVSSEYVRPIYAKAFGIPIERVRALGVPRTDVLFDELYKEAKREAFYASHPDLHDKTIVSYCPTFRQTSGIQFMWNTKIEWVDVSKALPSDMTLLVKRHPLEMFDIVSGSFDNILVCDDVDANTLCLVSDAMVTDYSSIIFDCALTDTPVVYYCPDAEAYDTDFYLDFPNDLNGEVIYDSVNIVPAITRALESQDTPIMDAFREKYMGACDGNATDRVAELVRSLVRN